MKEKNLLFCYLEQKVSCHIVKRLVAELAGVCVVLAVLAGVEVLAGEALVKVEALVLLHAPVEEVELAEFPHLGRFGVVGVETFFLGLKQINMVQFIVRHLPVVRYPPYRNSGSLIFLLQIRLWLHS